MGAAHLERVPRWSMDLRAHGGQGAVAGRIAMPPQVGAVLRRSDGIVRVWNGCAGKREEFTVDEARALCVAGDRALMTGGAGDGYAALSVLGTAGAVDLIVARDWLIAFLAAVRRALRTGGADVAEFDRYQWAQG